MIKCLPEEVQGKLRSGVAVPSLQQCVEELVLNSIDAGATCVGVRVDMDAFKVQVVDNGAGISADDMDRVGSRHHTSKCACVEDLDDLRWYGFRGEALASIASLATLVEISSRCRSAASTRVKIFKDGRGLDAFEADTARPAAGTTVLVCNFFHNMPVRRKRTDPVLEGERIRHRVEAVSLMHPSVSFTLRNDCTGAMMVQLPKARDTYHRFLQIHGLGRAQKLGDVSFSHGQFEVTGYIGREGHYNSSLQFLYVNKRLLLKTRIHKLLNLLLRRLTSESPDGPKRRQELHAVYVINIKCSYSEYDVCLEPAKTLIEFKDWDGVLLCVEEAVKAFLSRENLTAVLSQEDLDSPRCFPTKDGEREGGGNTAQDCSIGIKLASESVHRKHTGETSVCPESDLLELNSEGHTHCATGEGEPTMSPAGDVRQSKRTSSPVRQSDKAETQSNNSPQLIQSESNLTEQIRPWTETAGRKKISVCDPYRHESLEGQEMSHVCRSSFQQKKASRDLEVRPLAPKRKISLGPETQKVCLSSNIPRLISGQRSGSLDQFRRAFVKPAEMESSSLGAERPQNLPLCQDVTVNQAPSLPASTGPAHVGGKNSLAAKLCSLKQDRTEESHVSARLSGAKSLQDGNNNETPEPVPGWGTTLDPASGDWLRHYDTSVGKTVYVNRLTGLSRYEDPLTEEAPHDVTNAGTENRCRPFRVELALPLLSKRGTDRVISSGPDGGGDGGGPSTNSLSTLYSTWNNPVFVRPPAVGVDVSSGRADGLAVKIHNVLFPYRFSKAMIHGMKVIHQVDKKFLACLINTRDDEPLANADGNLLVLVDQHAAHERVRLESLVADSYEDDPDAPGQRRLCSSTILPPLAISVTEEELRLLRSRQAHLRSLGLEATFSCAADPQVLVGKVPLCFVERESNELRRGRRSVIKPLVEEYLQEQIELLRSAGRVGGTLPLAVLKALASLACHGAIKFNHSLSRDECVSLAASLSCCHLPFQCAHGRPSIVPLVDILHLDKRHEEVQRPDLAKLRRMYKAWEPEGNG